MDCLLWMNAILVVIGIVLVVYLIINMKDMNRDIKKKHKVLRNSWIFGATSFLFTIPSMAKWYHEYN